MKISKIFIAKLLFYLYENSFIVSTVFISGIRIAFLLSFCFSVWLFSEVHSIYVLQFIGASMGTSDLKIPSKAASSSSDGLANFPARACCVVVEFVPGGTLKSLLFKNRKKKLAFKIVVQLALDLARGWTSVSYVHLKHYQYLDIFNSCLLFFFLLQIELFTFKEDSSSRC